MHVTHAFHAKLYARSRVVRDILGHRSPAVMPMSVEAECEIREIVAQSRGEATFWFAIPNKSFKLSRSMACSQL